VSTDALSGDELLYRHLDDDWVDSSGNANELACTTRQWKQGVCCDRSSLRTPADTVFGTGRRHVLAISVDDCRSLGITVTPGAEDDPHRPGQMNDAHCTLSIPSGLTKPQIRKLRDEFLRRAKVITVTDAG
jgi:hypothetical protein